MTYDDTTAAQLAAAYDKVDRDLVWEVAATLRDTGRYGAGEADDVAADVLAALGILGKVIR